MYLQKLIKKAVALNKNIVIDAVWLCVHSVCIDCHMCVRMNYVNIACIEVHVLVMCVWTVT